ncbi:hypothetical protein V3R02_02310 [Fusobacterium nucleatum]
MLEIIKGTGKRNDLANKLLNTIKNIEQRDLNISIEELKNRINDIKLINNIKIINRLLQENFNREFSNQINNINTNEVSKIVLTIKDMDTNVEIKEGHLSFKKQKILGKYTLELCI